MRTVVISGARSIPALRIARAFASTGARVVTTDSLFSATAGVSVASDRYVRTAPPRMDFGQFRIDVERILREEKPELWIPAYEEIFYLARLQETALSELPLFASSLQQLARFHDKASFALFAQELGVSPRETLRLDDAPAVRALSERSREFVFKPLWSRGGERVLIQPSREQLAALSPTPHDPWIAQTYLPGEEVSTYAIAWHGQMLAHAAYRPCHRAGLGAAVAFEQVEDAGAESFSRAFIEATNWHGQVGFDMRRDENGRLLPMECNPRATSGIHFLSLSNLAAALSGQTVPAEKNGRMPMIGLAMLTYGLASALGEGKALPLWKDYLGGHDVLWDRNDPAPFLRQIPFLVEISQLARRRKISMNSAFTYDLEWDGHFAAS